MTEGRCGMCRWWGSSDGGVWRACRKATNVDSRLVPTNEIAFAYSEPPRTAWLMTRRGFGCVMWEAKGDDDD